MGGIASSEGDAEAARHLSAVVRLLNAESALFVSFARGDLSGSSYRFLSTCDFAWMHAYKVNRRFIVDPWLQHALLQSAPLHAARVVCTNAAQRAVVESAEAHGFRSAILFPAQSAVVQSRVGVLYLGSSVVGSFDGENSQAVRLLGHALAMELNECCRRLVNRVLTRRRGHVA
jgi:hypothetical protein